MKIYKNTIKTSGAFSRCGFTLVEVMVAAGIFVIVVGSMVAVQIYGLRVYTLSASKVIATTNGRETLTDIRDRIRSCQLVYVGFYTNGTFSSISNGLSQIGNALEIFPSTNASPASATFFYMDPSSNVVNIVTNGVVSQEAQYMTNYYCFDAENYQQNIVSNYVNNPVIGITLLFAQWEFPGGTIGSANAYDYFRLHTRVSRRANNNP